MKIKSEFEKYKGKDFIYIFVYLSLAITVLCVVITAFSLLFSLFIDDNAFENETEKNQNQNTLEETQLSDDGGSSHINDSKEGTTIFNSLTEDKVNNDITTKDDNKTVKNDNKDVDSTSEKVQETSQLQNNNEQPSFNKDAVIAGLDSKWNTFSCYNYGESFYKDGMAYYGDEVFNEWKKTKEAGFNECLENALNDALFFYRKESKSDLKNYLTELYYENADQIIESKQDWIYEAIKTNIINKKFSGNPEDLSWGYSFDEDLRLIAIDIKIREYLDNEGVKFYKGKEQTIDSLIARGYSSEHVNNWINEHENEYNFKDRCTQRLVEETYNANNFFGFDAFSQIYFSAEERAYAYEHFIDYTGISFEDWKNNFYN